MERLTLRKDVNIFSIIVVVNSRYFSSVIDLFSSRSLFCFSDVCVKIHGISSNKFVNYFILFCTNNILSVVYVFVDGLLYIIYN